MTRSGSPRPDASALCADVRELTRRSKAGGRPSFAAFEDLVALLLRTTILHPSGVVRLSYSGNDRDQATVGGLRHILDPLPLNDGRLLRLTIDLFLARDDPRGPLLKEFGVPCNQPATVWRPMLAEAERSFLEIAHQPLSGPAA